MMQLMMTRHEAVQGRFDHLAERIEQRDIDMNHKRLEDVEERFVDMNEKLDHAQDREGEGALRVIGRARRQARDERARRQHHDLRAFFR